MLELLTQYSSELVSALLTLLVLLVYFRLTSREADLRYTVSNLWKIPLETKPTYYGGALNIYNQGRAPARNVRVVYSKQLVETSRFEVGSAWPYQIDGTADGGKALMFDLLPPQHSIAIHYATTSLQANPTYVGFEGGVATATKYTWQQVYPGWFNGMAIALIVLGLYSAVVLILRLIQYLSTF